MRFRQIDRIIELQEGSRIKAVKNLSLAEEYLQDHFPRFPVMPGVLMLEAMYQASAWLVRKTDNFAYSAVVLKEARNVKFADFVEPGQTLTVTAELLKQDGDLFTLKTQGTVHEALAVSARLILQRLQLADLHPSQGPMDPFSRSRLRQQFELLYQPSNYTSC